MSRNEAPPAYAPGYNQVPQSISAPTAPQIVVQPSQQHYQQPVVFHTAPVVSPVHYFFGCCDAKIGWSLIYGIVLICKIISLIVTADSYFEEGEIENPGPVVETVILTVCLISLFIGMFKKISVCFWPIILYNGITTVLLSLQAIGCVLYVVGAQNFGIAVLKWLSYLNKVPFMPEPWDIDDEIDFDGDHVVGAISWLGMFFIGIGYIIAAIVYGVLTKGLNDYRKWVSLQG